MKNPVLAQSFLFFLFALLTGCSFSPDVSLYDLRCENLEDPLSIDNKKPHFSWKIKAGKHTGQEAYRILVASDEAILSKKQGDCWDTEKQPSANSVMIPYMGKELSSGSLYYWKVGIWDEQGDIHWSDVNRFGVGLLGKSDWKGDYIGLEGVHCPLLRKTLVIDGKQGTYLLHVASLGYHDVYINGSKMGDGVLSPAVSQLSKRALSVTYDISPYLKKGGNDIVLWLGQGWYREATFQAKTEGPLVKAKVNLVTEGKSKTLLVTDSSWVGRESEYASIGNWESGQFGGEFIDGRKILPDMAPKTLNSLEWLPVLTADIPELAISPQMCPLNKVLKVVTPDNVKKTGEGCWLADMGTTLNGYLEFRLPEGLEKGREIVLEYGDHFDDKGELVTSGQKDIYITSGTGKDILRNKFNTHVFQYVKIQNLTEEVGKENMTAQLVTSGIEQTASFECSDPDLNAIHDMVRYTFRNLTLGGYMVDCPHIERLGYGGDGNASTQALQTMYDVSPLYLNWMQAWDDSCQPDGGLPHTAPFPYYAGGGPYWGAFVIAAPWKTYVNYNDKRAIERFYPLMQKWLGYVEKYTVGGLLQQWPNTAYRNWYLGDWATPEGVNQMDEESICIVNNCCISHCFAMMEKMADLLGKGSDAKMYGERRDALNKVIHERFFRGENNSYASGSQIDLAYPMLTGVTPGDLVEKVTEQLWNETVNTWKGHLACGLVGVNIITDWAIENNQPDFMYTMLKKRDYPGYLYMIDNGATSTWEHWNGERSRIHNCYNSIGSWFYEAVGGIRPDENAPGYKHVIIQPQIPTGVSWAKTSKETPYGNVSVNWEYADKTVSLDIVLPAGCTGSVILPEGVQEYVLNAGKHPAGAQSVTIGGGKWHVAYSMK